MDTDFSALKFVHFQWTGQTRQWLRKTDAALALLGKQHQRTDIALVIQQQSVTFWIGIYAHTELIEADGWAAVLFP
jgi:hypothetical protein